VGEVVQNENEEFRIQNVKECFPYREKRMEFWWGYLLQLWKLYKLSLKHFKLIIGDINQYLFIKISL